MNAMFRKLLFLSALVVCQGAWAQADSVRMKNGDEFSGRIEVERLSVTTAYGQITLPRALLAELVLTGEGRNVETLVSVCGDRFSGFLVEPTLSMQLPTGNALRLRKETMAVLRFAPAAEALPPTPPDRVEMRNADTFQAEVVTAAFALETSYGVLEFARDDIARIEFEGEDRVIARVSLREDKGSFQGTLRTEEIELRTRGGQALMVYRDKFKRLDLGEPARVATAPGAAVAAAAAGAGAPVSAPYALVLRTGRGGSVPHSVAVELNGQPLGVFTGQRLVQIESHLRQGANTLVFRVEPIAGLSGDNHLLIKAGPVSGRNFSPEMVFSSAAAGGRAGVFELPYFVASRDAREGDIALFASPRNADANLPLVTDVFVDGRHVTTLTGPVAGLPIAGLAPGRVHTVRLHTRGLDGLGAQNWLNVSIGRVASVRDGNYQYSSLLEVSTNQGWTFEGGGPRTRQGGDRQLSIELPLSL